MEINNRVISTRMISYIERERKKETGNRMGEKTLAFPKQDCIIFIPT